MLTMESLELRVVLAADSSDEAFGALVEPPAVAAVVSGPTLSHRVRPSGDPRIDALLAGTRWPTRTLTYSFFEGGSYPDIIDPRPLSEATRASIRTVLNDIISPVIDVTFREVPDSPTSYGLIRYLGDSMPEGVAAYAQYPGHSAVNGGTVDDTAGDVVLGIDFDVPVTDATTVVGANSFQGGPGGNGFASLIHETLHALGLKHPGNFNASGGGTDGPYLPLSQQNSDNSVMTYNYMYTSPVTPMPFDVLALQYLYGARTATNAGDNVYTATKAGLLSPTSAEGPLWQDFGVKGTLWDGGGTDTLDLTALRPYSDGYHIDLRPGGWIVRNNDWKTERYDATLGPPTSFTPGGTQYVSTGPGTRIAFKTVIENVVQSSSNDDITLNGASNRVSGYLPGATAGADVMWNATASDVLDLTAFGRGGVTPARRGFDMVIGLGGSSSVTIKDFYRGRAMQIAFAEIGVEASDAFAAEGWPIDPGTFTLTRTGSTARAQTVSVALGGTAFNGHDYRLISNRVTFAAGSATATVQVMPWNDRITERDETVTLRILPGPGYAISAARAATVTIADHYGAHLTVKSMTGTVIDVYAVAQSTIDDIQQQIEAKTGISTTRQRLVFGGKTLQTGRILSDYNLQAGSIIHLIVLPKSGYLRSFASLSTSTVPQSATGQSSPALATVPHALIRTDIGWPYELTCPHE